MKILTMWRNLPNANRNNKYNIKIHNNFELIKSEANLAIGPRISVPLAVRVMRSKINAYFNLINNASPYDVYTNCQPYYMVHIL